MKKDTSRIIRMSVENFTTVLRKKYRASENKNYSLETL